MDPMYEEEDQFGSWGKYEQDQVTLHSQPSQLG